MAGTAEGVRKGWLKRKRAKKKGRKSTANVNGRPETADTLKKGQTLAQMAKRWKVSVKQLIKLNNLTSVDQIVAGMTLKIPAILSKAEKEKQSIEKALEQQRKANERASKPKKKKKSS